MQLPDWPFWAWILVGLASGIVIFPMFLGTYLLIRNTLERRKIKKMIKKGEFLQPIDEKDYDGKIWDKYLDANKNKEKLENLDEQIFKHSEKKETEKEIKVTEGITGGTSMPVNEGQ